MHELTNLMGGYHKKVKLEKVHSRTHRRYVTSENTKIGSMPKTGGWFHLWVCSEEQDSKSTHQKFPSVLVPTYKPLPSIHR